MSLAPTAPIAQKPRRSLLPWLLRATEAYEQCVKEGSVTAQQLADTRARVVMCYAALDRISGEVAAGLALWWISGGMYGLMSLGVHYCGNSIRAAWNDGMEAVVELPEWAEVLERNPSNRQRFLDQDRQTFIAALERWMFAYCPCGDELVPGLADADARGLDLPVLVFRSGESDAHHTRHTSERVAELLPNARLVEPPWGDREWIEAFGCTPPVESCSGDGHSLHLRC
jgi:pimeloyl-ACP methyl ester carboxylesterase